MGALYSLLARKLNSERVWYTFRGQVSHVTAGVSMPMIAETQAVILFQKNEVLR